ncbi:MAG: thioredoxin [Opitutae bacterium]|nr:thioredoxin [Opitutae bacterium]MCD8298338.1 thioredoxin [Opitutae bacterium]
MASANIIELDGANFDATTASGTALVDFWAPWCGPCRALGPVIEQIAAEVGDKAKICKVNVDSVVDVAARFGIQSIPTVLIFKNGEIVKKFVGLQSKSVLLDALS